MSSFTSNQTDDHGQPLWQFPSSLLRNHGKAVDQLIGIARGILCDGDTNDAEALAFRRLVEQLYALEHTFPFDMLKTRLDRIFQDGKVDPEEKRELSDILHSLGGMTAESVAESANVSCSFPIDCPPPTVIYPNNEFVVTGRFAYGTAKVHACIEARGGIAHDNVRQSTRYLIIGHFASRDWLHTSYGLKIQRAVELRDNGVALAIVSESHWGQYLGNGSEPHS